MKLRASRKEVRLGVGGRYAFANCSKWYGVKELYQKQNSLHLVLCRKKLWSRV